MHVAQYAIVQQRVYSTTILLLIESVVSTCCRLIVVSPYTKLYCYLLLAVVRPVYKYTLVKHKSMLVCPSVLQILK
jgi:hypothetical protein